jgi:tetratricopeptide (TPR) repeat protein
MSNLQTQAIQASLDNDWEIAIELNNQLLVENPTDISSLNRLARAYIELGQKDSARSVYEKVLTLDKYNPIATKFLKVMPSKNSATISKIADEDFVEEAGVTKSVMLVKPAGKETLISLTCKQCLRMTPRSRLIAVETEDGTYLGCLPDDLSLKLKQNLKAGYKYVVCLKSSSDNAASVFIRETHRPNRVTASASFVRTLSHK